MVEKCLIMIEMRLEMMMMVKGIEVSKANTIHTTCIFPVAIYFL